MSATGLLRHGRRAFPALGTTAVVLCAREDRVDAAAVAVADVVARVDAACSRFREDSELSRLNAGAGRPRQVSAVLRSAVTVALRAAHLTDGLVDPTIGEALRIVGYDRDFSAVAPDGPPLSVQVAPVAGWRAVTVEPTASMVTVPPGVTLDLGATAKAWCADVAAGEAASAAGAGVLVSLGGDIATAGETPPEGWDVRVSDRHDDPPEAPGQTVVIRGGGLATSGTTARRWQRGGRPYHHLIDPATGLPAGEHWRTVTVAAATCVDANTASTASVILGADAPGWLAERALPARLVGADGSVTLVGGWPC